MKIIKNKLSSKIKSKINFGYADVNIDGIEKTDFYAHSRVNDLESFQNLYKVDDTVVERMSDISLEPQERIFETLKVNSANEIDVVNGWDRIIPESVKFHFYKNQPINVAIFYRLHTDYNQSYRSKGHTTTP